MRETQESVGNWADATFGRPDPDSPARSLRVLSEVIELCLASGASADEVTTAVADVIGKERGEAFRPGLMHAQVMSRRFPEPDKVPAEAADVLIVLYGVAHMRGFDLHTEVDRKMHKNRYEREWIPRGDGTGYHKRSTEGATQP